MTKDCPGATGPLLRIGWTSPDANGVAASCVTQSRRQPGIAPYRMACSSATSNVSSDYIDPTVLQFIADLPPGLTIKAPIYLATLAAVDKCEVLGDL